MRGAVDDGEVEETVDQRRVASERHLNAVGLQLRGVRLALVAERVKARGDDVRWR